MIRNFRAEIIIEADTETLAQGLQEARKTLQKLGLKIHDIKPLQSTRTEQQNRALHLWLTQLSEELQDHGLDMKAILKEGFEFPATPYALKEFVWRPTQIQMFGKKSTTKLDKTEEINKICDVITRALIERTNGIIDIPPFPSYELLTNEQND